MPRITKCASLSLCLFSLALSVHFGCDKDDDSDTSDSTSQSTQDSGSSSESTNGGATTNDAGSTGTDSESTTGTTTGDETTVGTGTETSSTTGDGLTNCREATTEQRCLAGDLVDVEGAMSNCVWIDAVEFDVTDQACTLMPTDRGYCRGRYGQDEGCATGDMACNMSDVHVGYSMLSETKFELTFGLACRANEIGTPCDELLLGAEQPGNPEFHVCYCACDYYKRIAD